MKASDRIEIPQKIDEVALKAHDEQLNQLSAWVRSALEKTHKPSFALVSFNLNHSDRLRMIRNYCGIAVPEDNVKLIEGEPTCLILDYNETPRLLREEATATDRLELGLPFECLKNYRVIICDEIQSEEEWLALTAEIDACSLVVNATMAMTQSERTWLSSCAKQMFAANEIAIVLTKINFLNNEEDIEEVRLSVMNTLTRFGMDTKVFESESAAFEWMLDSLRAPGIQERYDVRILQNALTAAQKRIRALLDTATIDASTIQSTLEQLNKRRQYLELAGQMAAESVLANSLNSLKAQLCDGIRDYGRQMAQNIKNKVENTPLDQLESIEDKINGFISGSWDYYIKSMMSKAVEETEAISKKLVKQIEIDAGSMIVELDESARRTLYSSLGLSDFSTEFEGEITLDRRPLSGSERAEVSVGAITDHLRKETRNMMLLSIPLLFVNPLASVGTVFAAKAYGKFKLKNELTDIRSEMVGQVEKACYESSEHIAKQVEQNIEDEIRTGSISIKSAYGNLVSQIESSLDELKKSQDEKAALKDYLNNVLNVVFPQLMSRQIF